MNKTTNKRDCNLPVSEGAGAAFVKRVFVAIKIQLSPELQLVFNHLKMELKDEQIRWEPAEKLHITLNFIGDVSPEQLTTLAALLEKTAASFTAFLFSLKIYHSSNVGASLPWCFSMLKKRRNWLTWPRS